MTKRLNKGKQIAIVALVLTIVVLVTGFFVLQATQQGIPFSGLPEFPSAEYRAGESLWSNSAFRLHGTVENIVLESKSRKNQLVAIKPELEDSPLPVVFPISASKSPLARQQKLYLKVNIDSQGRIIASGCVSE